MANQVRVSLDRKVYDRLLELQVPPCSSINEVIEHLLFHGGHRSNESIALEAEEQHYSFDEELKRTEDGIYDGSGISS